MRILHTSDWHLGRSLYGRKRYEEFSGFLDWLARFIEENRIDALLVAGDVFDSSTPSNRTQELYYRFLCRTARSCCRHTVIIAGNHDSPSFLNAPKELLKALDVHVTGHAPETPEDEVLVLRDASGAPELIVCAVPYLRDKDIRTAEAGESIEDKDRKLIAGIRDHYAAVGELAERKLRELEADVPIVGMGHLFAAGGTTIEGDGVRDLYVGSLAHVSAAVFPECFDYLALGHLHAPQMVGGRATMRYSGSPLPMTFDEAEREKHVFVVEFQGRTATVRAVSVPTFKKLKSIKGDWEAIASRIREAASTGEPWWLEIIHDGDEITADLRERLEAAVSGTRLEILRIRNNRIIDRALQRLHAETLDDLSVDDVFQRCLDAHAVPEEQRPDLLRAYGETLASLYADDLRSE